MQLPDSLKSGVQRLKALPGGATPTARYDAYWKYLVDNEPYLARYMTRDTTEADNIVDGPTKTPLPCDYYAKTSVDNPHGLPGLARRVRNGFLLLTLSNDGIAEEACEVSAESGAVPVWSETHFCS